VFHHKRVDGPSGFSLTVSLLEYFQQHILYDAELTAVLELIHDRQLQHHGRHAADFRDTQNETIFQLIFLY